MGSRLLDQLRSSLNENLDDKTRESTQQCISLLEAYQTYKSVHNFQVGDFVKFKKGMSCRSVPKEDEVAIVTEVLSEPIFDPLRKSAGSPSFREPLNIRIGVVTDGMFQEFFMDGNRMEVVPYDSMDSSQQSDADDLKDLHRRLTEPSAEPLKAGDIVQWKKGLKNTKRPEYEQQCVVMETFPVYVTNKRGACASGFREPEDVRIGILDEDDDLMIYMFDSRRFEKVPESKWKI